VIFPLVIGGGFAVLTALPFASKWQLGIARVAVVVTMLAAAAIVVVAAIDVAVGLPALVAAAVVWLLTIVLAISVLAQRFYRDPERTIPQRDDLVLSPADGKIVYVREARGGSLPVSSKLGRDYRLEELTKTPLAGEDSVVVGISLSFLDVHVNRAPIRGRALVQRHFRGSFGSLRRPEMVFENERATLVLERDDVQIAVVMIASRLVRRIVTFIREGDDVAAGQRIGMIRFGSQVDVVLPLRDELAVVVKPGDRVVAGETAIAELPFARERSEDAFVRADPA
jgi:phosphatidylserine decarboxylase